MTLLCCHDHVILLWPYYVAMFMSYCYDPVMLPWSCHIAMTLLFCDIHVMVPFSWRAVPQQATTVLCHDKPLHSPHQSSVPQQATTQSALEFCAPTSHYTVRFRVMCHNKPLHSQRHSTVPQQATTQSASELCATTSHYTVRIRVLYHNNPPHQLRLAVKQSVFYLCSLVNCACANCCACRYMVQYGRRQGPTAGGM